MAKVIASTDNSSDRCGKASGRPEKVTARCAKTTGR